MLLFNETYRNNVIYSSYGIGLSLYDNKSSYEESDIIKSLLSLFLGASMVVSLVGNVCTCAVIARDKTMRTPTNFYLLNLAITDLMIALFVPVELYIIWVPDYYPLGEEGCRIHFLLWDLLSNCSVLTILAFTIERYLVIAKPFLRQRLLLTSRVFKIVTFNWVVSCIFSFPSVFYIYFMERKQSVYCVFTVSESDKVFMIAIELLVFFIIPMTVIFVLFVMIVYKLKSTEPRSRANPASSHLNRNKAVKMLAAVAASFFICWSPYSVLRTMILIPGLTYEENYNKKIGGLYYEQTWTHIRTLQLWRAFIYLSAINSYMSTAVNPILYNVMSRKFRQAFKDLLKGNKGSAQRRGSGLTKIQVNSNVRDRQKMTIIELQNT